jgi:glucose-1-phosphate cytidylyltransferase
MVEIGGKPILWHIMSHYLRYGFDRFAIALGYKGEQIKRYITDYHAFSEGDLTVHMGGGAPPTVVKAETIPQSWTVQLVETGLETETGARIKQLAPHLGDETFMLTYGDGVSNVDIAELVRFHREHGRLATMTVVHPPSRYGRVELHGDEVADFIEKPQFAGERGLQIGEGWINGGYFVLEPRVLDYIDDNNSTKWELAPLERLAKDGELMAFRHHGFWQCMDTMRDKNLLESLWNAGDPPWTI